MMRLGLLVFGAAMLTLSHCAVNLSPQSQTQSASSQKEPDVLCGIELQSSVSKLRKETERELGQPIFCIVQAGLRVSTNGNLAEGRPINGKPYIVIDQDHVTQVEVAHELFHWKLGAEGAPLSFDVRTPQDLNPKIVAGAVGLLLNLMEHRLFFPMMRAMGFDPAASLHDAVVYMMSVPNFQFRATTPEVARLYAVAYYIQCVALINDRSFTKQYSGWLEKTGRSEAAATGAHIASSIVRANPRTANQMKKELAKDLTVLFGDEFTPSMFTPKFATLATAPTKE